MDPRLSLADDEVHVWCADPAEAGALDVDAAACSLLSTDERERRDRFVFGRDRDAYFASRILVRSVLSRYEGVAAAAWQFATNEHGRPEIANPGCALRFNLSHTAGLVVCAVTRRRAVGVDAEDLRRPAPLDIVEEILAPREIEALRALPAEQRSQRFFAYWTLKESYVKARGVGLNVPLDRIAFADADGDAPKLVDNAASWRFVKLRPTSHHLVAVCVDGRGLDTLTSRLRTERLAELVRTCLSAPSS